VSKHSGIRIKRAARLVCTKSVQSDGVEAQGWWCLRYLGISKLVPNEPAHLSADARWGYPRISLHILPLRSPGKLMPQLAWGEDIPGYTGISSRRSSWCISWPDVPISRHSRGYLGFDNPRPAHVPAGWVVYIRPYFCAHKIIPYPRKIVLHEIYVIQINYTSIF
jgi:hypothetical protein